MDRRSAARAGAAGHATDRREGAAMNDMVDLPGLPPGVAEALADGALRDPFGVLGPHETGIGRMIRVFAPGALAVEVASRAGGLPLGRLAPAAPHGLFVGGSDSAEPYLLRIGWPDAVQETEDPYSFGPLLGELDLHLFNEGRHFELASHLGAGVITIDGVRGVRFAVWAPNARAVSVVGDFNTWDPRRHPMRLRYPAGVWELFIPRLTPGTRYKFAIAGPDGARLPFKADPLARATEPPPATASVVADPTPHEWHDETWMQQRARRHATDAPLSIYEVHAASWFHRNGRIPTWDELAARLVPYVSEMGFSDIEL